MNLAPYSFPTPNGGLMLSSGKTANANMSGCTAQLLFLCKDVLLDYCLGLHAFEKSPGLFTADTGHFQPIKIDDAIAIASINPFVAGLMLANGEFTWISPNWLIKLQGFWQHLKISAGRPVGPVGRVVWAASIFLAARKPFSEQDSWTQSCLLILVKKRRRWKSFIGDLAIKYWLKKKGPKSLGSIYAEYSGFLDHPLVELWHAVDQEVSQPG